MGWNFSPWMSCSPSRGLRTMPWRFAIGAKRVLPGAGTLYIKSRAGSGVGRQLASWSLAKKNNRYARLAAVRRPVMSLWSRIKKAAKKVWRVIKTVVRVAVKIVLGVVMRVIHMIGSLLDVIHLVKKKMRIQVIILRESDKQGLVTP